MALEFCEHADVVFEDAPLTTVLSQVRFPHVLSLLTVAGVTGFQTALRDEYPVMLTPNRKATFEVTPDAIGASASAPVWRMTDEDQTWTVGLAVDFVSLETPKYSDISEFLSRFERILRVLRETVRPAPSVRIGFRKVNTFEVEGRDTRALSNIIRTELLGPLAVDKFPAPVAGCFGQLHFADDDNLLAVRHGLVEREEDGPMKYVVDLDYFTERPMEVDGSEALVDLLRHFSDGMTSFFHWAVTDSYKATLKPRSRAAAEGPES